QLHAVAHHRHDQTTDHRPGDPADPAGHGCAADEAGGDRVQLEHVPGARLGTVHPGGVDDAGDRGQEAHVRHHPEVDRLDLHPGELGRVQVAPDGVDVPEIGRAHV